MSPAPELRLPAQIHAAVLTHARFCLPHEACGLLACDGEGRLQMAYPLTNAAASPLGFTIEPREHFGALMHAERHGWRIAGVFHSHPASGPELSPTDLSQPHESQWIHVVVGFLPEPRVGVWRIEGGHARPVSWDLC